MTRARQILLLVLLLVAADLRVLPAGQVVRYTLVTSAGPIGTLTVTEVGSTADNEFRVDNNGRGAKLREHVELGPDGLPRRWTIEGRSEYGAPVKETFAVENGRARWMSLDDSGDADGKDALYLANNGTPWALGLYLRALLATKTHQRSALPGGVIRAESVRTVQIGPEKDEVTAYAIWGLDVAPHFILARKDRLVAVLDSQTVLVEERHEKDAAALLTLSTDLSGAAMQAFTARLSHRVEGPLWLTNVRVFEPVSATVGAPVNVGVFRGRIVAVGSEPPPADAVIVDGGGGTLLPGLFDAHAHMNDWEGALHMAAGVTLARDPGNDNDALLQLERRIDAGEIMGPRLRNSGFLEGLSPYSARLGFVIDSVDDAKAKVQWYAAHGYWGIKIYNSMNPEFVKPIAEEAHRLGLHVSGHVPAFMSSERAVRDGYDEIHHINQLVLSFIIDPLKDDTRTTFRFTVLGDRLAGLDLQGAPFQRMVALMKERHTVIDPTMATFSQTLLTRPGIACPADVPWIDHMPSIISRSRRSAPLDVTAEQFPGYEAGWKKLQDTLLVLYRSGIPLVPGTDDVAGMVLHAELEAWVEAGIPAPAVLRIATLGGARFLGLDQELGTVARGKLADVYLVDGDPTREIGAIRRGRLVVKGDAVYYPDEIHEALGITPFAPHAALRAPSSR